jgi:hypothetical protein
MDDSAPALSGFPTPSFSAATPFAQTMARDPDPPRYHPKRPPEKPAVRGFWDHYCPDSSVKLEYFLRVVQRASLRA